MDGALSLAGTLAVQLPFLASTSLRMNWVSSITVRNFGDSTLCLCRRLYDTVKKSGNNRFFGGFFVAVFTDSQLFADVHINLQVSGFVR